MTHVQVQGEIGASADAVWALVGDFGGFVKALGAPVDLEGEGIGTLRTIKFGSRPAVVERLEELDHDAQRITYTILEAGPLPVGLGGVRPPGRSPPPSPSPPSALASSRLRGAAWPGRA